MRACTIVLFTLLAAVSFASRGVAQRLMVGDEVYAAPSLTAGFVIHQ
jgi:hypothetical protein